jgi:hydrogenase nickel incorporation protein HypA/HybF
VHEVGIAQNILDIVVRHADGGSAGRVTRVTVKVGALATVVPDCLTFAFEALARGTCAEKATLQIEDVQGRGTCRVCGAEFPVKEFLPACAHCGSPEVAVAGGDDLTVESMEIE